MEPLVLKTANLNGKLIAFTNETQFLVQVGKGKNKYTTKHKINGNLGQAVSLYNGINVGRGYKKRLLMPSCTRRPTLARQFS